MTITARDIEAALSERYAAPEWAFIPQMPDGTGANASRRADAVAMSLWPSRGLYLSGFEVKVTRADWKHEKSNPAKADRIARYCRFWWLVTSPDVIRDLDVVPATWGHMVFDGKTLDVRKPAPQQSEEPLTLDFIAGLFRGVVTNYVPRSKVIALAEKRAESMTKKWAPDDAARRKLSLAQKAVSAASTALWHAAALAEGRDVSSTLESSIVSSLAAEE